MPQVTPAPSAAGAMALLALASSAALPACGPANTLEGSLTEVIDLSFSGVEVSRTEAAVIVGYHRPRADARDIVLKLVVAVAPKDVVAGKGLELAPAPDGTAVATLTRAVAEDPVRTFATIRAGTLTLDATPSVDAPVSGSFRVTLGEGGEAGKGRTVFGTFKVDRVVPGE